MLRLLHSKTAQAVSSWIGILSAVFAVLSKLTPEWFGALTWPQSILLGIALALAASLILSLALALGGWGFRFIKPVETAPASTGVDGSTAGPGLSEDQVRQVVRDEISEAPLITTGEKWPPDPPPPPKPRLRLSRAEQERVTDKLIKLDDYLTSELSEVMLPVRNLLTWQERLRHAGAAKLHEEIEALRQPLAGQQQEIGQTLRAYQADTDVLGLNPMAIKTKFIPLHDAIRDFTNVSEAMAPDSIQAAPLLMPGRQLSAVIGTLTDEIERVRRDIADWRKLIAKGEMD